MRLIAVVALVLTAALACGDDGDNGFAPRYDDGQPCPDDGLCQPAIELNGVLYNQLCVPVSSGFVDETMIVEVDDAATEMVAAPVRSEDTCGFVYFEPEYCLEFGPSEWYFALREGTLFPSEYEECGAPRESPWSTC